MKTKPILPLGRATFVIAIVLLAFVAGSTVSLIGCSPASSSETELDQIPAVPPLNRGPDGLLRK